MKRFLFFLCFLQFYFVLLAQDTLYFANHNLAQTFLWQHLDTNLITEKILIDKVSFGDSKSVYQKGMGHDSVPQMPDWLLLYNSLRFGELDTTYSLPPVEQVLIDAQHFIDSTNTIPIFSIRKRYNKIKVHSDSTNYFSFNQDGSIAINYAEPEDIFETDSVFAFSFLTLSVKGASFPAVFSSQFSIGMEWDSINEIAIRLGQSSWSVCSVDVPFYLDVPDSGLHVFEIRLIYNNNDTLFSKTAILRTDANSNGRSMDCVGLIEPDLGPNPIWYDNGLNHQLVGKTLAEGRYSVWFGCKIPGRKKRPFLIVAGFNPRNTKTLQCYEDDYAFQQHTLNFSSLWRGTYYDSFNGAFWLDFRGPEDQLENTIDPVTGLTMRNMENNGTTFLQHLRELGYDVWILAPNDGMDRIENNGMLIGEMIKYIRSFYVNNWMYQYDPLTLDQVEELVVMGVSAGAWACRYGLTLMEKNHAQFSGTALASDYPHHHVRLWISHEGEFYGANTPLGFQYFVDGLASSIPASALGAIRKIIAGQTNDIIESPAGKQLSRYEKWNSNSISAAYLNLKSACENLNPATRGYPEWCRNVALSQGSTVGSLTLNPNYYNTGSFYTGSQMFSYLERAPNNLLNSLFAFTPYTKLKSYWGTNSQNLVYKREVGIQSWTLGLPGPVLITSSETQSDDTRGWDYAPGGSQATSLLFYKNTKFSSFPGFLNVWNEYSHQTTLHSFSPTVGTFDIRTPSSNYTNESIVLADVDGDFDVMNKRIDQSNQVNPIIKSTAKRFGYPHLKYGSNAKLFSPFGGICGVGDPNQITTILPNHFHVDDFQPDFNEFLFQEIFDGDVFIQNRRIGNLSATHYQTLFQANGKLYAGQAVMQDHSDYWKEPVGKVEIHENKAVELTGTEILLKTGFEVLNGGWLHGYLSSYGTCNENMAERRGNYPPTELDNSSETNPYPSEEIFQPNNSDELVFAFYPNPLNKEEASIRLKNAIDVMHISLLDLSGRTVFSEQINREITAFTFPALESGTYIITVQTTLNKEYHEKIILY